ncbi:hypothetical protein ASD00_31270 [Ensifer sp. Root31]|uniref:TMAO reductase system periplasmic protein TorT n=1 Tax=Ensifer sp. Root31 TaxID=1736512 RepID=UPI00070A3471|nr:TMAO reductase system periplasmic protein TorT [Ensifer sp. Root31]KQU86373.1 hypothetical protein ASD00_31270 [Ensifer sp. Root31]
MHKRFSRVTGFGLLAAVATVTAAAADDYKWWPWTVEDWSTGSKRMVDFVPPEKAVKRWHICAILPHMKDSWWVAIDYGLVAEAERLGVKLTVFEAGGYGNLVRQVAQYDDCLAIGADAIIVSAISQAGVTKKVQEGKSKGVVQIALANPIPDAPVDAHVLNDPEMGGYIGGTQALKYLKTIKEPKVVVMPGPAGAGFAEAAAAGFAKAVQSSNVKILDVKYGDLGKSEQLRLVEDALQTYDHIDMIFGAAVTAEVAGGAIEDAGRGGEVKVATWYSSAAILDGIKNGDVYAATVEWPVAMAQVAVDLAVQKLEKSGGQYGEVRPVLEALTVENIGSVDLRRAFAPEGFQPIFSVE